MQPLEISQKWHFSLAFFWNMIAKSKVVKWLLILKCMGDLHKAWALAPPIDVKSNFARIGNKRKQTEKRDRSNSTTTVKIKSPHGPDFYITNKMNLEALLLSSELGQGSLLKYYSFISTSYFCLCCRWCFDMVSCGSLPNIHRYLIIILCIKFIAKLLHTTMLT